MKRDKCENAHAQPVSATVCLISDLTTVAGGIHLRHEHLCRAHASVVIANARASDHMTERTPEICFGDPQ